MKQLLEGRVILRIFFVGCMLSAAWSIWDLRATDQIPAEPRATAVASEQRMRRVIKPRITIVTNKCSLDQAQRIWQVLALDAPNKPEAGALIPFADLTAFYDGREWWCSETKGITK